MDNYNKQPRIIIITQGISRIVKPVVNKYNVVGCVESPARKKNNNKNFFKKLISYFYSITIGKSRNLKLFLNNNNIPYYLMDNGSDLKLENWIKKLKPDVIIVYLMSQLLKKNIFEIPTYKTINLHPAFLPEFRGPNPWFWYYYYKKLELGITLHYIDEGEDTGDIIYQEKYSVPLGIKSPEMQNFAISEKGVKMIFKAIDNIHNLPKKKQAKKSNSKRARNININEHTEIIDFKNWSIQRIWHVLRGTELWLNALEQPSGLNKGQRWVIDEYKLCDTKGFILSKVYKSDGRYFVACNEGKIYLSIKFSIKNFILNIFKNE